MTSSLRNSLHRRNHKERSQLAHRTKLGILEKHKDYVKRARDYHSKQSRLHRLKQKAAERNKDEFYFSMIRERTKNGVHMQSRGNAALPTDIVKILKTQDENYVRTMRASGVKKIDKIKNRLTEMADLVKIQSDGETKLDEDEIKILRQAEILRDSGKRIKSKHILFATSSAEASLLSKKGKQNAVFETQLLEHDHEEEDLGWKSTQPKRKLRGAERSQPQEQENRGGEESNESRQEYLDRRKHLLKELSARLDRDRKLRYAQREFEMQRLMMGKGARKKIQGVERVEGDKGDDEEDEDGLDAQRGKQRRRARSIDEETYRPRVYKWRLERKK